MIRVAVTPDDLAGLRFRTSALVEASAALRLVRGPCREPALEPWTARVRAARADTPLLDALHEPGRYVPDFIPPPAPRNGADPRRELESLAALAPEEVAYHVAFAYPEGVPGDVRVLAVDPAPGLRRLCGELRLFWGSAMTRVWSACRAVAEGDLLFRARQLATDGPEAVLDGLHPGVSYRDGVLEIESEDETTVALRGNGIGLVPSVFTDRVRAVTNPDLRLGIAYPPRGLASVERPTDDDRLARLLGSARADLLRRLREPGSTQELAALLDVTPSAVSQRIGPLSDAGIVASHRVGRHVHHTLTEDGRALLDVFDR